MICPPLLVNQAPQSSEKLEKITTKLLESIQGTYRQLKLVTGITQRKIATLVLNLPNTAKAS
jgi:hypothetical protein